MSGKRLVFRDYNYQCAIDESIRNIVCELRYHFTVTDDGLKEADFMAMVFLAFQITLGYKNKGSLPEQTNVFTAVQILLADEVN